MGRRLFDYGVTALLFGVLAFLAARLDRTQMREATGAAIVADGDSLRLGAERIRLRGIDAPEYTQFCNRNGAAYACGREARNALVRLVAGNTVSCTGWRRDRYGRLLGDCRAGGRDINRSQVEDGWAVAYGDFEAEQAAARTARRGIWAGTFEEPQEYRRHRGEALEVKHDFLGGIGDWLRAIFLLW
jgi:endonuclease YncB( thermonuclease family)